MKDSEVARLFREGMADRSLLPDDDMQRFDSLLGVQWPRWRETRGPPDFCDKIDGSWICKYDN